MKKSLSIALILVSVAFFVFAALNAASAQVDSNEQSATAVEEVTTNDLGVENPGLLPTNPFYFLKEWGRGIKMFFTFNKVAKIEYQLKVANQKAAELKKVEELKPEDAEAIQKAFENYEENIERLKTRLQALQETSENPNVDKLLDSLADRALKHEQLFEELKEKHEQIRERVEQIQGKISELVSYAAENIDSPERFRERLEQTIQIQKEAPDKEMGILRFMNRVEEQIGSEEILDKLDEVKERVMEKVEESGVTDGDAPEEEKPEVCIELYDPVCGVDGETYGNECKAKIAGVKLQHKGECAAKNSKSNGSLKFEAVPQ